MARDEIDEQEPLIGSGETHQVKATARPISEGQTVAANGQIADADGEANEREGIPNVGARLKYIVPAVGIGIFLVATGRYTVPAPQYLSLTL